MLYLFVSLFGLLSNYRTYKVINVYVSKIEKRTTNSKIILCWFIGSETKYFLNTFVRN